MSIHGTNLLARPAVAVTATGRHARPAQPGLVARTLRFVRELPGRTLGPRRESRSSSDAGTDWVRSLADSITRDRALQAAVDANDFAASRRALRDGANPRSVRVHRATAPAVADLIDVARRVRTLYADCPSLPPDAHPQPGDVDAMMRTYDVQGVRAHLSRISPDPAWLWGNARYGGKEYLLRALLAVLPDSTVSGMARTPADRTLAVSSGVPANVTTSFLHTGIEPGEYSRVLTNYLAAIPALDPAQVQDNNGSRDVFCRHWSALWIEKAATASLGPIDYSSFHSAEDFLRDHSRTEWMARYDALRDGATELYFVGNHALGAFANERFADMKDGESRLWLVNTTYHAMALELGKREEDGETVYSMRVYDPNVTTSHVAAEARDPELVRAWRLEAFLHHEASPRYLSGENRLTLMTALPEGGIPAAGTEPDPMRRISAGYGVDPLREPAAVWHLFDRQLIAELKDLPRAVAAMPPHQAIEILAARPSGTASAYFQAAGRSNEVAVAIYVAALKACGPYVRDQVLGRLVAEFNQHLTAAQTPGTTADFTQLLAAMGWNGLSIGMLLAMPAKQGGSLLYWDLSQGRQYNIAAIGQAMRTHAVPPEQCRAIFAADRGGVPGLAIAMHAGHAAAVRAFSTALRHSPLNGADRLSIVRGAYAADGWQHYALASAYQDGRPDAVRAYCDMAADCLHPVDAAALMTEILCATTASGAPCFGSGAHESVRQALLQSLPRFAFSGEQVRQIQAATGLDMMPSR